MPLAYFHYQNGSTHLDQEGVDLPDHRAIQAEATATIAAVLREDDVESLWKGQPIRLWVTDGPDNTGKTVFALNIIPE
ncbi:MAG: hypothetical protein WAL80_13805 [Xanthobacteraceae bacterium]|jgi:hypothetical protein